MAAPDFTAMLNARGLRLARVSSDDVADREKLRAAFREYVKAEDAERFGLKEPPALTEGQLALVGLENNQPVIHALHEIPTADLPSVAGAERELGNGATPAQDEARKYLSIGDLVHRWRYSKQGLQRLTRRQDFPPPCFSSPAAQIRIWALRDIERYEQGRPELCASTDAAREAAKKAKMRGFARARWKGRTP